MLARLVFRVACLLPENSGGDQRDRQADRKNLRERPTSAKRAFTWPRCSGLGARCGRTLGRFAMADRQLTLSGGAETSRDQPGPLVDLPGQSPALFARLI